MWMMVFLVESCWIGIPETKTLHAGSELRRTDFEALLD